MTGSTLIVLKHIRFHVKLPPDDGGDSGAINRYNNPMAHFPSELSDLPSKEIFPPEMPRYPNLWFYVDTRLALRGRYRKALQFLVMTLEERLGLRDSFVQGVQNHNLYHMLARPGEGSDFRARVGPIQCYENYDEPSRSHWHQLHARFPRLLQYQ